MSAKSACVVLATLALACNGPSPPARLVPAPTRASEARPLAVRWVGEETSNAPLIVLLHGWGAPGDDLVPLGERLRAELGSRVRVAVPAAPLERPPSGRAWWALDLGNLRPSDRGAESPDGLAAARRDLVALLEDLVSRDRLRPERTVLVGFSQGAMLATDVALSWEREVGGVAILSGGPIDEARWTRRMRDRPPRRVFMSHASNDPLLRFAAAERLRDRFERAGATVTFVPHEAGHAIPEPVITALVRFLDEIL